MGAYLSQPITDKFSSDESNDIIICGASSMQGWRKTQEDAHNCILQYDEGASLFAVYDGHGGKEVAEYTAQKLPDFIKSTDAFKSGDYEKALKEAFLNFDATLKEPEVVNILKEIAGVKDENHSETEEENIGNLQEEAQMPIEEVMAKYASTGTSINPNIQFLKNEEKKLAPVSPYLRAKGSGPSKKDSVECSESSSSKTECESASTSASSSKCHYFNEADSEVSSSSSSSCVIPRKSLSEKYSNGETSKTVLDSTSNGTEEVNNGECKKEEILNVESCPETSNEVESECSKDVKPEEKSSDLPDSSEDLNKTDNSGPSLVNGNGTHADDSQVKVVEDKISSSVENGEVKTGKGKGKGKAPLKKQQKSPEKKASETPEKLFEKFVQQEAEDDESDSDSDDVTFNGPDSTSDDEDDVGGDEDEEGDDDEDEEDSEDYEGEDEDDDDEFTMNMTDELKQCLRCDGSVKSLLDSSDPSDDDDDDCCGNNEEYGKNFLINVLKNKVPGSDSGCTAVVALLKDNKIYVANAGDSRCIVSKNGEAVEMSLDHKPEDELELARIVKAGGEVSSDGRVNGGLNLSRALGDHVYKQTPDLPPEEQMISPLPDVKVLDLDPDVEFMVLACDGIWNFMSSKEVVEFVRPRLLAGVDKISKVCEELFDHCLAPCTLGDGTGCDNMTAVIVQFKNSNLLSSSSKKRRAEDEAEVVADDGTKRQKTEDVISSTDSVETSKPDESSEKDTNTPDTTQ